MSFAENPPKQYVPWQPNKPFVKFFQDMRNRRISATDSPTMRVTNTSPPSLSGQDRGKKARSGAVQKSNSRVKYSTPSDIISRTAESQTGKSYKRSRTVGGSPKQRKKKASKTAKRLGNIEKKIKKFKF